MALRDAGSGRWGAVGRFRPTGKCCANPFEDGGDVAEFSAVKKNSGRARALEEEVTDQPSLLGAHFAID